MEQLRGWGGGVGQRVVVLIGIGPSFAHIGAVSAVGGKYGVALGVVGVHKVGDAAPQRGVVVDMKHHHAAPGQVAVPPLLLAVLHDVVFVGITVVAYQVGLALVAQGEQPADAGGVGQLGGHEPAHQHALVGGVTGRTEAALVVVAVVHQVPVAHNTVTAVVEIGKTETVAILMADGAETAVTAFLVELGHRAVAVYKIHGAVVHHRHGGQLLARLLVFVLGHPPLVGPDGVAVAAGVLTLAGIENEQLVHVAVAVPVVDGPFHLFFLQHFHDVVHQILRVLIVGACAPVFGAGLVERDVIQVEGRTELTVALVGEVVAHRTEKRLFHQPLGVEYFLPLCQRLLGRKGLVVEVHQHGQLPPVAYVVVVRCRAPNLQTAAARRAFTQHGTATADPYRAVIGMGRQVSHRQKQRCCQKCP